MVKVPASVHPDCREFVTVIEELLERRQHDVSIANGTSRWRRDDWGPRTWTRMARQTIYGFKLANLLCHFEPWYEALVQQLMALPAFEYHWQPVKVDAAFDADSSTHAQPASVVVETVVPNHPERARLRPLLISVGYFQFDFPQIVAFLPADDLSRDVLRAIGIPVPDTFPTVNQ